ncbi:MAG: protein translocase subunit SecD [Parcubacteria group bacterium CG10_big_fil_rev_8_21_14_0_10_36_14]|nr:MAG: protein translocase subunit SecD [Parcubacteria group bacterium CG10_big_fil_rev_8_21_14_0_10_36_14]
MPLIFFLHFFSVYCKITSYLLFILSARICVVASVFMKQVVDLSSIIKKPLNALKHIFASGSNGKLRLQSFILIIFAILVAFYVFPPAWNRISDFINSKTGLSLSKMKETSFHVGLDLQGGTHLVYEADTSNISFKDQSSAVQGVRDVIERRVNALGVSEPLVQTNFSGDKWRVIVELAGVKNVSEAIKQIGETPILQFKEQSDIPNRTLTSEEQQQMDDFNKKAEANAKDIFSKLSAGEDYDELAFKYSEDPGSREAHGDLDWLPEGTLLPELESAAKTLKDGEVYNSVVKSSLGYHIIKKTGEREIEEEGEKIKQLRISHIFILTKSERDFLSMDDYMVYTELSGKDLENASVQFDPNTSAPEVALQFNSEGKKLFKEITERNVGKYVGIYLDGEPITIPRVNDVIYDGSARISGNYDLKEAKLLAQRLNAGALPVPIHLVSQQTIGASLGKISVEKSLWAGAIGLALVCLFMILYYRLAGLASVLSLLIYGILILAIFKFVPVTLSLAGIAGFILSIGMAVDANVLIFERLKEELAEGVDIEYAITESFKRAWPSIRDGNISTLITAAILFWFSTSVIKGFALTLSLGILVSMFSAMFISRIILRSLASFVKKNWWMGR